MEWIVKLQVEKMEYMIAKIKILPPVPAFLDLVNCNFCEIWHWCVVNTKTKDEHRRCNWTLAKLSIKWQHLCCYLNGQPWWVKIKLSTNRKNVQLLNKAQRQKGIKRNRNHYHCESRAKSLQWWKTELQTFYGSPFQRLFLWFFFFCFFYN